jgi:hypothetical protein
MFWEATQQSGLPGILSFAFEYVLMDMDYHRNIITRGFARAISGPKKVSIFRAHPFRCPS